MWPFENDDTPGRLDGPMQPLPFEYDAIPLLSELVISRPIDMGIELDSPLAEPAGRADDIERAAIAGARELTLEPPIGASELATAAGAGGGGECPSSAGRSQEDVQLTVL